MFNFEKDTLTMIAVAVCILTTIYMFTEMNKQKQDVSSLQGVSMQMMDILSSPPPPMMDPREMEEEEVETTGAENTEEN